MRLSMRGRGTRQRHAVQGKGDASSSREVPIRLRPHVLDVRVLGQKRAASAGKRVDVDAFVVLQ